MASRLLTSALLAFALVCACRREERVFHVEPSLAGTIETVRLSGLQPGPTTTEILTNLFSTNAIPTNFMSTNVFYTNAPGTNWIRAQARSFGPRKNHYEENAWALSEGKRLFFWFNCNGCHGHGGGGMGPALIDSKWIYGYEPEQIVATIAQGRPNGMPSFQDRIPAYQVWQIAAYVRSISGLVPIDAAPARLDHMRVKPPENTKDPEKPRLIEVPR